MCSFPHRRCKKAKVQRPETEKESDGCEYADMLQPEYMKSLEDFEPCIQCTTGI